MDLFKILIFFVYSFSMFSFYKLILFIVSSLTNVLSFKILIVWFSFARFSICSFLYFWNYSFYFNNFAELASKELICILIYAISAFFDLTLSSSWFLAMTRVLFPSYIPLRRFYKFYFSLSSLSTVFRCSLISSCFSVIIFDLYSDSTRAAINSFVLVSICA